MLPDRVSNPGPLTYESGALPIALRGPALLFWKNGSQFFVQKLTQYGSMREVYINTKIWVGRRLNFRATVHKMPDFLFL